MSAAQSQTPLLRVKQWFQRTMSVPHSKGAGPSSYVLCVLIFLVSVVESTHLVLQAWHSQGWQPMHRMAAESRLVDWYELLLNSRRRTNIKLVCVNRNVFAFGTMSVFLSGSELPGVYMPALCKGPEQMPLPWVLVLTWVKETYVW